MNSSFFFSLRRSRPSPFPRSQFAVRSQPVTVVDLNDHIINLYELYKELINENSATQIQAAFKGYANTHSLTHTHT